MSEDECMFRGEGMKLSECPHIADLTRERDECAEAAVNRMNMVFEKDAEIKALKEQIEHLRHGRDNYLKELEGKVERLTADVERLNKKHAAAFERSRSQKEALAALTWEVDEKLNDIACADMLYSDSQKKNIEVWTIEGCAVFNCVKKEVLAILKKGADV